MPAFSTSNIHLDVLMGRDESLDTADFMMSSTFMSLLLIELGTDLCISIVGAELRQPLDIHGEMEKKLRM